MKAENTKELRVEVDEKQNAELERIKSDLRKNGVQVPKNLICRIAIEDFLKKKQKNEDIFNKMIKFGNRSLWNVKD